MPPKRAKRKPIAKLTCQWCGQAYTRSNRYAAKSKACSRQCQSQIQRGPKHPGWKGGLDTKTQRNHHIESTCDRCSATAHLELHHRDEDKRNNDPANLETLCRRCHKAHHVAKRRDPKTGRFVRAA